MANAEVISSVGEGDIWPASGGFQPLTDCFGGKACGSLLFEGSPWTFVILTLIIGGGCAYMAGRALALGWRPAPIMVLYALLTACAVRFLHFGLLRGTLMSPWYFLIDFAVLLALAALGFRYNRASQMTTQYPWLYRQAGPLNWALQTAPENGSGAIAGPDRTS